MSNLAQNRPQKIRNPRLDLILERLVESPDFLDLIAGYAVFTLDSEESAFPGEKVVSGKDLLADLQTEIEYIDACISQERAEDVGNDYPSMADDDYLEGA